MPQSAARLDNLPPYIFSVIGDRIRQMQLEGIDVYRLDIGNPDLPPPDHVIRALCQSAEAPGHHGYTGYRGWAGFREAVAAYYQERFSVSLNPETQVLPVIGSKEGIVNLCLAYLDRGDTVLVPDIGYPSYSMGARLAGADVHWVPLNPDDGFKPQLDTIPDNARQAAKLLWINYPNNPTGAIVSLDDYRHIVDFCTEHDILLVSDNPYMDVVFDGYEAPSALQADPELTTTVEFFSFSKSYNMAGWRLGAAVGSGEALSRLLRVKSNVDSGHFRPIYDAGCAALKTPTEWVATRNARYQDRRNRILDVLPDIGLTAYPAQGSLYVWARVDGEISSADYTRRALAEAHVSLAPGEAYGPGGEGYIRISIGVPDERLDIALDKLKAWYGETF